MPVPSDTIITTMKMSIPRVLTAQRKRLQLYDAWLTVVMALWARGGYDSHWTSGQSILYPVLWHTSVFIPTTGYALKEWVP